jgi:hypothetical protein
LLHYIAFAEVLPKYVPVSRHAKDEDDDERYSVIYNGREQGQAKEEQRKPESLRGLEVRG